MRHDLQGFGNTLVFSILRLKCDDTRADARFRLSGKRTSPFKSAGVSVQSTTGSLGVRISGRNAGYTMFRGSVKSTDYPLHSPVSLSLPLPCVTVCHHISTGLCKLWYRNRDIPATLWFRSTVQHLWTVMMFCDSRSACTVHTAYRHAQHHKDVWIDYSEEHYRGKLQRATAVIVIDWAGSNSRKSERNWRFKSSWMLCRLDW
jgi:hypothetical protein